MGVVSIGHPSQRTGIGRRLHLRMLEDWACLKAEGGEAGGGQKGRQRGARFLRERETSRAGGWEANGRAEEEGRNSQVLKSKKLNHRHLHRAGGEGLKMLVHHEGQDGP